MMQNNGNPLLRLYDPGLFFLPSGKLNYPELMDFLTTLGHFKNWSNEVTSHHATAAMQVFEYHRDNPEEQRRVFLSYLETLL